MSDVDVVRAWKDEEFRLSLSDADRAELPTNPAGLIELSDDEIQGGGGRTLGSLCCGPTTSPLVCRP